jgi:hypothetical protein
VTVTVTKSAARRGAGTNSPTCVKHRTLTAFLIASDEQDQWDTDTEWELRIESDQVQMDRCEKAMESL